MGYLHIDNLYKNQRILLFRECYALEKIEGSSAHVAWRDGVLHFHAGGTKAARFQNLFNEELLKAAFAAMGHDSVTVFGEVYGGSVQKQAWRYGENMGFVAFDVQVGEMWLSVPQALDVVEKLSLEFVSFEKIPTDLTAIDAERDKDSVQASRRGKGKQPREGVVLRPPMELTANDGERIIAKHKRDDHSETKHPRKVVDPAQLEVLTKAQEIADEWVTPTRLQHVLSKLNFEEGFGMEKTREVISAMLEDVLRESAGEIVDSKDARIAISKKAAQVFQAHLKKQLQESAA